MDKGVGLTHKNGVAGSLPADDGRGPASKGSEKSMKKIGPHLTIVQGTELEFAMVPTRTVLRSRQVDDAQNLVAPWFVALGHGIVEGIPTGGLVVDDDMADVAPQALTYETTDGLAALLAQPTVVVGSTLGRCTGIDVEADGGGIDMTVALAEALLEGGPTGGVVGKLHIDDRTVEAEQYGKCIRSEKCILPLSENLGHWKLQQQQECCYET